MNLNKFTWRDYFAWKVVHQGDNAGFTSTTDGKISMCFKCIELVIAIQLGHKVANRGMYSP